MPDDEDFLKDEGSLHTGADEEGGCTLTTFTGGSGLQKIEV